MAKTYGTLSADGETSIHVSSSVNVNDNIGAKVRLLCTGTFGGGSVTIQSLCADGVYRDMPNGTFSIASDKEISVSAGVSLKAILAGSTSPSLYYEFSNIN